MFEQKTTNIIKFWFPVFLWCGVIYFFSDQPDLKSELAPAWDLFFRKLAHIAEYAILTFLLFRAYFKSNGFSKRKAISYSVIFAAVYAFTDEYHQTFILGREGCLRDVFIDSIGIFLAAFLLTGNNFLKFKQFKNTTK